MHILKRILLEKKVFSFPDELSLGAKLAYFIIAMHISLYYIADMSSFLSSLYSEDNLFENMTFVLSMAASIIFFYCGLKIKVRSGRIYFLLLASAFFFFAMEEISWGQRIFGWHTSEEWSKINYQKETNLHNLLNPYLGMIDMLFFFMVGLLLTFGSEICRFCKKINSIDILSKIWPGKEYVYLGWGFVFLALESIRISAELLEELFAISAFIYALDSIRKLKYIES
jgi:hypothetical protein